MGEYNGTFEPQTDDLEQMLARKIAAMLFSLIGDNGKLDVNASVELGDVSAVPTGTAGSPNAAVVTVQGITNGTGLTVATHAVTQSGTWNVVTTNAGTFAVQAAQSGTWNVVCTNGGTFAVQAAQSGAWNITNISGTVSLPTGASTEATLSTLNGKVTAVNTGAVVLAAGTAIFGKVYPALGTAAYGTTKHRTAALHETAVAVKASAGNLYGYNIVNRDAAVAYVKLYDTAQGSVTVGTTTPVFVIQVPASGSVMVRGADLPIQFATAISAACVTGSADNSTGAPTTGVIFEAEYV